MSEALILESVNPQRDKIFFIDFSEKYKFRTYCVQILFWTSKQKTILVHNLFWTCIFRGNSMNNLSSYCGLTDSRMRASDTDLPVLTKVHSYLKQCFARSLQTIWEYSQMMSGEVSLKISWEDPQIVSCKDRVKSYFEYEWTLEKLQA